MDDEKDVERNVTILDGDEIGSACSVIGLFNWFLLRMHMSFFFISLFSLKIYSRSMFL